MRPADHAARNPILAFRRGRKCNGRGAAGLNRLLDPQFRNVQAVLHVRTGDIQGHNLARFHANHWRIDGVFLHDDLNAYVCSWLLPAAQMSQQNWKKKKKEKDYVSFHDDMVRRCQTGNKKTRPTSTV